MKIKVTWPGTILICTLLITVISQSAALFAMDLAQQTPAEIDIPINALQFFNSANDSDIETIERLWDEDVARCFILGKERAIDLERMQKEGLDPLLAAIEADTPNSVAVVDFLIRKGAPLGLMPKAPYNHFGKLLTCEQDFERRLEKLRLLLEGGMFSLLVRINNKLTIYSKALVEDCDFNEEQQAAILATVVSFFDQQKTNGLQLYEALPGILGEFLPPVTHSIIGEYAEQRYPREKVLTMKQKLERIARNAEEGMKRSRLAQSQSDFYLQKN